MIFNKIDPEISEELHVSAFPEYKMCFLECSLSMSEYMCSFLASQRSDGFYSYSELMSLYTIGRCKVNMNFLVPKTEALHSGLRTQNGYFLENGHKDFE